ncbi:MAG: hypothetical protein UU23_C0001G0003 [Candidatus Curtissbacteria bacterium GW2011_GWA1_40_9]|uniref:Prolipoprotein diacylglyceryl transferase n=1 Tax=Candidatus Curtissbacteria bacterium GW2011_GWA1_40_9 TaxID=1618408 RepID=A0A0G0TMJ0_9BACT|nr:MAG: hypothetical protein UU23_C0001G0003 [Candidatus Curtissbacteria bacterium GW2011_GWA1_40_9]
MFGSIISSYFASVTIIIFIFLAFFSGVFLYWRSGKRELVENQTLFDVVAVFLAGAFVIGRLIDFFVRVDFYGWSLSKLVFFNVFWGLDIYGAFLGGVLVSWFYLRRMKENFWEIFDFAAGGLAIAAFFYLAGGALHDNLTSGNRLDLRYVWAFCYLLIFWVVKRLGKQKKHGGFFASLFLVSAALVNLIFIILYGGLNFTKDWWPIGANSLIFVATLVNWYMLAKRKIFADVKNVFGFILLTIFKTKRVLTNIQEADNIAKSIVFSPAYLAKGIYFLVKYVGREVYLSFVDLIHAFGVGK